MARPKKPLQVILGNNNSSHLSKKEIKERLEAEIKAPVGNIEPPSYFPNELKDTFMDYAKTLIQIGIMSDLDIGALERYVVAEFEYRQYTGKLLRMKSFGIKYFDLKELQGKAFKEARAASSDLGLNISSRCKLVLPKTTEEKPKNKFSKFAK